MAPDVEALLDGAQQVLIPLDAQLRMQAALHQDARAAQVDGLLNLFEDDFLRMDVAFGVAHGPVEGAEAAIFGAEIGVVDVAVDDVADHAFRDAACGAPASAAMPMPIRSSLLIQVDRFRAGHHAETPTADPAASFRYSSRPCVVAVVRVRRRCDGSGTRGPAPRSRRARELREPRRSVHVREAVAAGFEESPFISRAVRASNDFLAPAPHREYHGQASHGSPFAAQVEGFKGQRRGIEGAAPDRR